MPDVPSKQTLGGSSSFFAITKHDTNELTRIPRALYIGTGGNLVLVPADDPNATPVTFKNLPSGYTLNAQPCIVKATDSSAADIVGLL